MDDYRQYAKQRDEERTIEQKRRSKIAAIISVVSTTIGILILAIGVGGYLANTEIVINLSDFYAGVGWSGGLILSFGNIMAAAVKWG